MRQNLPVDRFALRARRESNAEAGDVARLTQLPAIAYREARGRSHWASRN